MSYGMLVGTALPPECQRRNCEVAYAENIRDLTLDVGHNGDVAKFSAVASASKSTLETEMRAWLEARHASPSKRSEQ